MKLTGSGWDDAGEELLARFLFRAGVMLGRELVGVRLCIHRTSSFTGVSFGGKTGLSSGFPIKSDSGSRVAGVDGGNEVLMFSAYI